MKSRGARKRAQQHDDRQGTDSSHEDTGEPHPGGLNSNRVQQSALKILATRPRSESELKDRLLEKYSDRLAEVENCIVRLKEMNLIDDARLAENYAAYRTSTKPIGPSRLARELASRKVSAKIIEDTLGALYDRDLQEELIDKAIEKRLRTRGHEEGPAADRRMAQHLARLGFDLDLIFRKIRRLSKPLPAEE
jgi:SOS response regulatory protein OraA/RecX